MFHQFQNTLFWIFYYGSALLPLIAYAVLLAVWWPLRRLSLFACVPWLLLAVILCSAQYLLLLHLFGTYDPRYSSPFADYVYLYTFIALAVSGGLAITLAVIMIAASLAFYLRDAVGSTRLIQRLALLHPRLRFCGYLLIFLTLCPTFLFLGQFSAGFPPDFGQLQRAGWYYTPPRIIYLIAPRAN